MPRNYKCISGDGHIDLNPDIWRDRVQSKWRERAPKRVKMPNGSDAVVIDGGKPNTIGITRSVRVPHAELAKQVPTFETCGPTRHLALAPIGAVKSVVNYFTGSNACSSSDAYIYLPYPVKEKARVPFSHLVITKANDVVVSMDEHLVLVAEAQRSGATFISG
jgi:hypothetical protein